MEFRIISEEIEMPSADPRIQYHLVKAQEHKEFQLKEEHISVIARVTDLDKWQQLGEVEPGIAIAHGGQWTVTASIPLSRVQFLHKLPFVVSLKASQKVRSALRETTEEIGLTSGQIDNESIFNQGGAGVVVGIVDFGGDFYHNHFLDESGNTRLLSLWDQGAIGSSNSAYGYGQVYSQQAINNALRERDPYRALGYRPNRQGSHGTHVMDIAAGSGSVAGVAPEADLIFVEFAHERRDTIQEIIDTNLGDSRRLIEAVHYIFEEAGDRPCVVNLSLGTNGGPHDGTTLVEQALDDLVESEPNRAIVIAAGNAFEDQIHQSGVVTQGDFVDVVWDVDRYDPTHNEIEIWYSGRDEFLLEIINPNGQSVSQIALGQQSVLRDSSNQRSLLAFISHATSDNEDNVIHLFQSTRFSDHGGRWTLRLHGETVQEDGGFHAWIERDDGGQSQFYQSNPSHTLGSISNGSKSVVVGSYNAHHPNANTPLSSFSGAGPTRDGRRKPEVSAPGHNVWAASSLTRDRLTRMSGTSMAAPAVTGLIARIFGQALETARALTIDETRDILMQACRDNPPQAFNNWHARYGFGRVSAQALTNELLNNLELTRNS